MPNGCLAAQPLPKWRCRLHRDPHHVAGCAARPPCHLAFSFGGLQGLGSWLFLFLGNVIAGTTHEK